MVTGAGKGEERRPPGLQHAASPDAACGAGIIPCGTGILPVNASQRGLAPRLVFTTNISPNAVRPVACGLAPLHPAGERGAPGRHAPDGGTHRRAESQMAMAAHRQQQAYGVVFEPQANAVSLAER